MGALIFFAATRSDTLASKKCKTNYILDLRLGSLSPAENVLVRFFPWELYGHKVRPCSRTARGQPPPRPLFLFSRPYLNKRGLQVALNGSCRCRFSLFAELHR